MTTISLKYSNTQGKRPNPANLALGELAINTVEATGSTALYFKDSSGGLVKVGPPAYQETAPNATPPSGGYAGNSFGELWINSISNSMKIYTGTTWASTGGPEGKTLVDFTALGYKTSEYSYVKGVVLGANTGSKSGLGPKSIWIGAEGGAGKNPTVGQADGGVLIGYRVAYDTYDVGRSVLIGTQAADSAFSSTAMVTIGTRAARGNSTGGVAIGYEALTQTNNTQAKNVAIGYKALSSLTTGTGNIGIGSNTLLASVTGNRNTAIGEGAGSKLSSSGSNNIFIGINAGTSGGDGNVCIGTGTGAGITGSNNILLGFNSGNGILGGSNNTIIGPVTGSFLNNISDNFILADGDGNIRMWFNANGALAFGTSTTPNFGTDGAPLMSTGSGGAPKWGSGATKSTTLPDGRVFIVKNGVVSTP